MQNRVINVWINVARGTLPSLCEIMKVVCGKNEHATVFACPCFMKPIGNFYKSPKILLRSLLLLLVVLSEMKTYCVHKTSSHRRITLSYSEIHWCAALLYKSNFFLISRHECKDEKLLYHHHLSSSSLLFVHFYLEHFGYLQTNASHVRRAHFTVEVDFFLCWPISWML